MNSSSKSKSRGNSRSPGASKFLAKPDHSREGPGWKPISRHENIKRHQWKPPLNVDSNNSNVEVCGEAESPRSILMDKESLIDYINQQSKGDFFLEVNPDALENLFNTKIHRTSKELSTLENIKRQLKEKRQQRQKKVIEQKHLKQDSRMDEKQKIVDLTSENDEHSNSSILSSEHKDNTLLVDSNRDNDFNIDHIDNKILKTTNDKRITTTSKSRAESSCKKVRNALRKLQDSCKGGLDSNYCNKISNQTKSWECSYCTFINTNNPLICDMCHEEKVEKRRLGRNEFMCVEVPWCYFAYYDAEHRENRNKLPFHIKRPLTQHKKNPISAWLRNTIKQDLKCMNDLSYSKAALAEIEPITNTYYKAHLNWKFVETHYDIINELVPNGFQLRRSKIRASTVIAFYNIDDGVCDTHFDQDPSILYLISGSKEVYLAPQSYIHQRNNTTVSSTNRTIFDNIKPFDTNFLVSDLWKKVKLEPGDCLYIPKRCIHAVKSTKDTLALSFQTEEEHEPRMKNFVDLIKDFSDVIKTSQKNGSTLRNDSATKTSKMNSKLLTCSFANQRKSLIDVTKSSQQKTRPQTNEDSTIPLKMNSRIGIKEYNSSKLKTDNFSKEGKPLSKVIQASEKKRIPQMNDGATKITNKKLKLTIEAKEYGCSKQRKQLSNVMKASEKRRIPQTNEGANKTPKTMMKSKIGMDEYNPVAVTKCDIDSSITASSKQSRRKRRECGIEGCKNGFMRDGVYEEMYLLTRNNKTISNETLPLVPVELPRHLICKNCQPITKVTFQPSDEYKKDKYGRSIPFLTLKELPKMDHYSYYLASLVDYKRYAELGGNGTVNKNDFLSHSEK